MTNDLVERLRRLGFRVAATQLAAFLDPRPQEPPRPDRDRRAARRPRGARTRSRSTSRAAHASHASAPSRPSTASTGITPRRSIARSSSGSSNSSSSTAARTSCSRAAAALGKTMIALNLGQAALAAGFTVRFSTLAAALADLLDQESLPAFERRIRRYTSPDLLILDELGYLPCDSPRRRVALQHHQPPPRAALHDHLDEPGLQAVGHHVPGRRVRRRTRRPLRPALPPRRDPRRILARQASTRYRPPRSAPEPVAPQARLIG